MRYFEGQGFWPSFSWFAGTIILIYNPVTVNFLLGGKVTFMAKQSLFLYQPLRKSLKPGWFLWAVRAGLESLIFSLKTRLLISFWQVFRCQPPRTICFLGKQSLFRTRTAQKSHFFLKSGFQPILAKKWLIWGCSSNIF